MVKFFNTLSRPVCTLLIFLSVTAVNAAHIPVQTDSNMSDGSNLIIPKMDAQKGKKVYVEKGCVACHAVNGVGGHDASAMDAHREIRGVNPFGFAARMWNHAPGMIAAQEDAFDEQVTLTGDDLANITAFAHDDRAQHGFSEKDLTDKARELMDHTNDEVDAPTAHQEEIGRGHTPAEANPHAPGKPKHTD